MKFPARGDYCKGVSTLICVAGVHSCSLLNNIPLQGHRAGWLFSCRGTSGVFVGDFVCGGVISRAAGRTFLHVTSCERREELFLPTYLVLDLLGDGMHKFHLNRFKPLQRRNRPLTHQRCHRSSSSAPRPVLTVKFSIFAKSLGANWNLMWSNLPFPKADEVEHIFFICWYFIDICTSFSIKFLFPP